MEIAPEDERILNEIEYLNEEEILNRINIYENNIRIMKHEER